MNPIVRNILAVIIGVIVGGFANMAVISLSGGLIAPPEGVDPNDIESIKANMHLYEIKHFIMPFLAHAFGALVAGVLTAFIAVSKKTLLGTIAGGFFFIGGAMMIYMIPQTPIWFILLDLIVAYFPMGWLGAKIATSFTQKVD